MKTLMLILSLTILFSSCGGNSSGGSKNDQPGARRNPSKPSGNIKALTAKNAESLFELSRGSLENLVVGDVFEKHSACENIANGETTKGDYIRRYTVLSTDLINRSVSYKVDVLNFPAVDSCGDVGTDKTFLLQESLYGEYGESLLYLIERLIVKRKYGLIESGAKRVLFVSGELNRGDIETDIEFNILKNNVEMGLDLNQSFMAGYYQLSEISGSMFFGGKLYKIESYTSDYTYKKGRVDTSDIDISYLPLFYTDPND
jgi:hypothetical protein